MHKLGLGWVSVGVALAVSACGGYADAEGQGVDESVADVENIGEAACANPEGANYSLASLAAATAKELKRWDTAKDFQVVKKYNYSMAGWQEVVDLTATGKAACSDGVCKNVQTILDFQKKEASGKIVFPGGATLQSDIFAQRLVANLKNQITCNSQPDNHDSSNCPAEKHTLEFSSAGPGACESDYWFHAYKAGTTSALAEPKQLKNQLITFGSNASNPYLAFDTEGDDVKVDPGPGTVGGDPSTSGSCPTLTISGMYSSSNIAGTCCHYQTTANKKFAAVAWSTTWFDCK
ncbi:MAG TPA: hypothetical protein VHM70_24735 [Polyangiaceae bacterium]|jgi:hypothetical protein|nr:hypothetical protein [Polyangiaceae bacterium]